MLVLWFIVKKKIRITLHLAKDKSNFYSTVSSSCIFTVSCTSVKSHLHRKFLHRHLHISCPVILFRYTIVLPRDGLWGAQDENGTWNGIIKDLQDKVNHYNGKEIGIVNHKVKCILLCTQ